MNDKKAEIINGSYAKDGAEGTLDGKNLWSSSASLAFVIRMLIATKYINAQEAEDNELNVLDIGCSNGNLLKMQQSMARDFNTKRLRYVGVDIRAGILDGLDYLTQAQQKLVYSENGDICEGTFCKQLFKKHGKFDIISAMEVIEHIPEGKVGSFMVNIGKLLKPNGKLILSTPIHFKKEDMYYPNDHTYEYTLAEMRKVLGDFTIENEVGCFPDAKKLKSILSGKGEVNYVYRKLIKNTKLGAMVNNLFGMAFEECCRCMVFICTK